jgi:entry exclusion lipoprotein TrbK
MFTLRHLLHHPIRMHFWITDVRSAGRRGGAVLAFALLAACGEKESAAKSATPLPPGVTAVAADARIPMPPPQDPACQPSSIRKVFRQVEEWDGYWQYGLAEHCPRPQLPAGFDWSKEHVVFVTMGRRDSPADSITVQGSGMSGDSVLVVVRRTTRAERCPTEARTPVWPRDLARIPAVNQPAKFVEQHIKLPCPEA